MMPKHLIRRFNPIAQAVLALVIATQAFGATRVFTGGINGSGEDWSLSSNWQDQLMPVEGDSADLGSHDVVLDGILAHLADFNGSGKLSVYGALSFSALSSVGHLAILSSGFSSGLLAGTGSVNTNSLTWYGGQVGFGALGGGVTLNVNGNATLKNENGIALFGSTLNLNGWTTWTSYMFFDPNIQLSRAAPSGPASTINIADGSWFDDFDTGLIQTRTRYIKAESFADGVVNNAGVYAKSGVGSTIIQSAFNNTGVVLVYGGSLALTGLGQSAGGFSTLPGATLRVTGGSNTLSGAIANAGTLSFDGGDTTITGSYSGGGSIVKAGYGTLTVGGSWVLPSLTVSGGIFVTNGKVDTGTLLMSDYGTLAGTGTVDTGSLSWSGGRLGIWDASGPAVTVNVRGGTAIGPYGFALTGGSTLNLNGGTQWASGYSDIVIEGPVQAGTASTLNIAAGTQFTDEGNGTDNRYVSARRFLGVAVGPPGGVVNNAGSWVRSAGNGTTFVETVFNNSGSVNVNAGTLDLGGSGTSTGSFSILAGATLNFSGGSYTLGGAVDNAGALSFGGGTTVLAGRYDGGGSMFVNGGKLAVLGTPVPGPFHVLGIGVNGVGGQLVVTGAGAQFEMVGVNPVLQVGALGNAIPSFSVLAGGTAAVLYVNVASSDATGSATTGTLLIDGVGSKLNQIGTGVAGTGAIGAPAFTRVGRDGGIGVATVTNGGQWLISDGGQDGVASGSGPGLQLGFGAAGASGSLTISGVGSSVEVVAHTLGLAPGNADNHNPRVTIGAGASNAGLLTVDAGGQLLLTGNAVSTIANPRTTVLAIGAHSATSQSAGQASVSGAGAQIALRGNSTRIAVGLGPNSTGLLNVLDGGLVASTNLVIGDQGAKGTVSVDNAAIALTGYRADLANQGAGITIGRGNGSIGVLALSGGAQVTITNDVAGGGVSIGGDPYYGGGQGAVTLSGGSSIQLLGGVAASVHVGDHGFGTMTLAGGSGLAAGPGGQVSVGRLPGTSGFLSLSSGSSLSAGYVGVGSVRAGGAGVDGGQGVLVLDNSTLSADTLEVGGQGVVTGDNGVINANVINRGILHPDPPGVPGTLIINGSLQNSAGGRLLLDIASDGHGGFTTSSLIFTAASTYDFTDMRITFSFLGATDPKAFLHSGAFVLDTFLQSRRADGVDAGLSANFGAGQNYASWFASDQFSANADSYVISDFAFTPDGTATFNAVPVPEPGTWAMLLFGLAGFACWRRKSWPCPQAGALQVARSE